MFVFLLENLNRIVSLYFKIQKFVAMIQDKANSRPKLKNRLFLIQLAGRFSSWFKYIDRTECYRNKNILHGEKKMIFLILEILDLHDKQILETSFWSKIVL